MCCPVSTTAYVKGSHRSVRNKYEHCLGKKTEEMWTKHVLMKPGTESETLSSKTCAQLIQL